MPNYKRYYLENRYVFITVVTYNRSHILIDNVALLRACFKKARTKFDFEIFSSVILPDHIHIMLKPQKIDEFSKIIGVIKRNFTQSLAEGHNNENISESRIKRREKGVWQRRFYEHIIRDENDLHRHLDYIHYNPVKHGYVKKVKDWEYSSFHKFIRLNNYDIDWGIPADIKHINELNYE